MSKDVNVDGFVAERSQVKKLLIALVLVVSIVNMEIVGAIP